MWEAAGPGLCVLHSLESVPWGRAEDPLALLGKHWQPWSREAGGGLAVFVGKGGGGDAAPFAGMVME